MKTQIFALALVMVVALGATALPAMAATTGESEGSFALENKGPELTGVGVVLYQSDESTVTSEMMPGVEYAVKISVKDLNTLNDIATIVIVVKEAAHTTGDSATHQATYQWSSTGGWSMTGPGGTWGIDVADCDVPTLAGTSGDWCLHFTPGKVAIESVSNWKISATVTDKGSLSDSDPELTGLKMLWYGELTALDTSFGFGTVYLNDVDKPIATPDDHKIDVKTIANGNYKLESKSANWGSAILDWDGSGLDSGHFQLENDGNNTVISTNNVGGSYTTITNYPSVTAPTAETGDSEKVHVWLSVADTGLIPQKYSGTFNVQIAPD